MRGNRSAGRAHKPSVARGQKPGPLVCTPVGIDETALNRELAVGATVGAAQAVFHDAGR
jgi:hypothetical protein